MCNACPADQTTKHGLMNTESTQMVSTVTDIKTLSALGASAANQRLFTCATVLVNTQESGNG